MSRNQHNQLDNIPTYNTASDITRKIIDTRKYTGWVETTTAIPGLVCCNVVAPSSGCYQRFTTYEDRNAVIRGQGNCTDYCPISQHIPNDNYVPSPPSSTARIIFHTLFTPPLPQQTIMRITGTAQHDFKAYLNVIGGSNQTFTEGFGQTTYLISNNTIFPQYKVYYDVLNGTARNITSIDYDDGGITTIENLPALYNLQHISLDRNPLTTLAPISSNTKLETIYAAQTNIRDIVPLQPLSNLKSLYISYNYIHDITPLTNKAFLQDFVCENAQLEDITPLAKKPDLRTINVSANKIADLSPLATSTKIIYFSAESNKIRDITPMLSMSNLIQVNLEDNLIQDINPLLAMLAAQTTPCGIFNGRYQGGLTHITPDGQAAINTMKLRGWVVYV
jgi:Leucine-rich repeat (LRR) protein